MDYAYSVSAAFRRSEILSAEGRKIFRSVSKIAMVYALSHLLQTITIKFLTC